MRLIRHVSAAALCCAFLTWAASAAAQVPGPSGGPLVLEPLSSGFVIAPDLKVTKINGRMETLAGGYAAHIHDQHLLVGGGAYWLANGKGGRQLGYGGAVAGWIFCPDSAVSFTAKGLVGVGWLQEPGTTTFQFDNDRMDMDRFAQNSRGVHFDRQFFVAEPELDVHLRLSEHLRMTAGGSYRLVDLPRGQDDLAKGPSGNVSLQFRFGK